MPLGYYDPSGAANLFAQYGTLAAGNAGQMRAQLPQLIQQAAQAAIARRQQNAQFIAQLNMERQAQAQQAQQFQARMLTDQLGEMARLGVGSREAEAERQQRAMLQSQSQGFQASESALERAMRESLGGQELRLRASEGGADRAQRTQLAREGQTFTAGQNLQDWQRREAMAAAEQGFHGREGAAERALRGELQAGAQRFTAGEAGLDRGLSRDLAAQEQAAREIMAMQQMRFQGRESEAERQSREIQFMLGNRFQGQENALDRAQREALQIGQQNFTAGQSGLDRTFTGEQNQADRSAREIQLMMGQRFQGDQAGLDRGLRRELQTGQQTFETGESALDRANRLQTATLSAGRSQKMSFQDGLAQVNALFADPATKQQLDLLGVDEQQAKAAMLEELTGIQLPNPGAFDFMLPYKQAVNRQLLGTPQPGDDRIIKAGTPHATGISSKEQEAMETTDAGKFVTPRIEPLLDALAEEGAKSPAKQKKIHADAVRILKPYWTGENSLNTLEKTQMLTAFKDVGLTEDDFKPGAGPKPEPFDALKFFFSGSSPPPVMSR